jgi:hypothetical protein
MKNGFLDHSAVFQVLDDDPLQKLGRNSGVPDALRIDDDDRSSGADAEARSLASFDPRWPKQQVFAL